MSTVGNQAKNTTNNKIKEIKKVNQNVISQKLSEVQWNSVLKENEVNSSCNTFINILKDIIDGSTLIRTVSSKKRRLKPWITDGLLTSIRERDRLKKQCTLHPGNIDILNTYRVYRNNLTKIIKKCKYQFYKTKIGNGSKDIGEMWRVIKEVTNDNGSEKKNNKKYRN